MAHMCPFSGGVQATAGISDGPPVTPFTYSSVVISP